MISDRTGLFKQLKPCPFCGSEARTYIQPNGYLVKCGECSAMKLCITKYRRQVVAEWNQRAN